jgi:hypothetical protein
MKWDDVTISRKEYDRLRSAARGNDIYVRAGRIMAAREADLRHNYAPQSRCLSDFTDGYARAIRDQREAVLQAMVELDAEEPARPVTR